MFAQVFSIVLLLFVLTVSCLLVNAFVDFIRSLFILRKLRRSGLLDKSITPKEFKELKNVILVRDIEFYLNSRKNPDITSGTGV